MWIREALKRMLSRCDADAKGMLHGHAVGMQQTRMRRGWLLGLLPGWLAACCPAVSLPCLLTTSLVLGLRVPGLSGAFGFVAAAPCLACRLAFP